MPILTDQDFANAKRDISDIDKALNTKAIVSPRYGASFKSLPLAIQEVIETGGFEPFATESALLASRPVLAKKAAKALDTKKVWLWDGTKWNDTGLSELDLAIGYFNDKTNVKTIEDGTDLNTLIMRGDYAITRSKAATYSNIPPQIASSYDIKIGGTLTVIASNEAPVVHQIYHAHGEAGSYIRSMISTGIWTEWFQISNKVLTYHDKDLNLLVKTGLYICNTVDALAHHYPLADQLLVSVISFGNVYRQIAYQRSNSTIWTRSYWGSNGWQNWVKLSSQSDIDTVNQKIAALDLRKVDETSSQLKSLYNDLHSPLMSVNIRLVGDSITWGSGASNISDVNPRNGTLSDARNTTDPISPTWANLLRQWLCATFTDGTLVHEGNGSAYASSVTNALVSKDTNRFKFKKTSNSLVYTEAEVRSFIVDSSGSNSGEYIDLYSTLSALNYPNEVEFTTSGTGVTLVFAKFNYAANEDYKVGVYVDDVFQKHIGLNSASAAFNFEETIVLPDDGKHKITLKNESTLNYPFRLQQIKHTKTIRVVNDGIIGSSTRSWLNSVKLSNSIKRKDDYVFVQLGTNDRITSANNSIKATSQNLRTIVDNIYTLSSSYTKIILMSANEVTQDQSASSSYFMTMRTVNQVVKQIADEKKVSFISNFEYTQQLKIDGTSYLADGLHPNDLGHRTIFENIKNRILIK